MRRLFFSIMLFLAINSLIPDYLAER